MRSSSDESDNHPATSSFVSEETFEVEGVVDERVECGQKVYRIRWKGFGPEGDTWEPEDNLSEGCAALLEEYTKNKKQSALQPAARTGSNVPESVFDAFTPVQDNETKRRSRSSSVSSGNSTGAAHIDAVKKEVDDPSESVSSTARQTSKPRKAAGGRGRKDEISAKAVIVQKKESDSKPFGKERAEKPESSNDLSLLATDMPYLEPATGSAPDKSTTNDADLPPKKKRGRPKKNPPQASPNKGDTSGNKQERGGSQPKKRNKTKSIESNEEYEGALTMVIDDDDSSLETDDASTSSRQARDNSKTPSATTESFDDNQQRKRRRRTEVDNLYVADRVPDWTELVLQEGIVGAEETAAGKRVTRQVVQRVKKQISSSSPSSAAPSRRTQSASRTRKRRDNTSTSAADNTDRTIRRESGDERESVQQERDVTPSTILTTNNESQDHTVAETSAGDSCVKECSKEIAVPPVPVELKQTAPCPVQPVPTVIAQDSRGSAQTATVNDHGKPQQLMEEPTATGRRRRPVTDDKLLLPISFGLDLNQEFKRKMKLYQLDKGQPVRQSAFERACIEGDLTVVRNAVLALKNKQQPFVLDVNAFDRGGYTLLMRVCMMQCSSAHLHEDVMEYLVQAGADVNHRHAETGQFALHLAVNANSLCKVKKLISLKAAVNVADRSGVTPLMLAAQFNRQHIVFVLLEFGADYNADSAPDRRSGERRTALRTAEEAGHTSTAGVILSHSRRVREHFDTARSKVLIDVRIKREISPLHVFGLWESPEFHVFFPFEVTKLPNFRYGFIVVLAVAQFIGQQVQVRLWGPSPFNAIMMNDEPLRCLQEDGRFVFLTKLKTGMNCLKIKLDKNARDSQMRMIVQVFLVQLNQPALPRPPSMPLEAADKI